MEGLTDNYLRVEAWSPVNRWNEVNLVELKEDRGNRISGVII
jgi:hypothetical protein